MPLEYTKTENVVIVYLNGRLDILQSKFVDREIDRLIALESKGNFLFNMAGVEYVNSYGLRVIVKTFITLNQSGRKFAVCNINNAVRKLFEVIGNVDIFEIFNSEKEAIEYLK